MRINVTCPDLPDYETFCQAIRPVWESRWLTNNGRFETEFTARLANKLGVPHTVLFVNGHLALEALLSRFPAGSEIITTPFSFSSTTHAIVRKGLVPVFGDIREQDYTLDPILAEKLITSKTAAILPVHVYGHFCDVDAFESISKKYGIPVLYDAAHTFGETLRGKSPAAYGWASMFSFHATKVFHSIEGGCVGTFDEELKKYLLLEKNFGIEDAEHVSTIGGNAKMNEFQAIMGLLNLEKLDFHIAQRKQIYELYNRRLCGIKGLRIPPLQNDVVQNYAYYPLLCENGSSEREQICSKLLSDGIYARKYFYPLINDYDCYRGRAGFDSSLTPIAKRIASGILTLPLYSSLPLNEAEHICDLILQAIS